MIKTGKELAAAAVAAVENFDTLYVNGCFGAPLTQANKARWKKEQAYNRRADRAAKLDAATADTFGFDCVCFIKGLLWGWSGDKSQPYGGAQYASGGVPDITEGAMIEACRGVSMDFSHLEVGEVVWLPGHIGIYVGDGLVAECTPAWSDGCQLTACNRSVSGYPRRDWVKHGKLPWLTYPDTAPRGNAVYLPTLRQGDRGATVRALQLLLTGNGFQLPRYGADGEFGAETAAALLQYQKSAGLAADAICGSRTWNALLGTTPEN